MAYKQQAGLILANIGIVYYKMGNHVQALEYYFKAMAIAEEENSKLEIAKQYVNIGRAYLSEHSQVYDTVKAEEYLLRGLALTEDIGMKQLIITNYEWIAELYKQQKDWEKFAVYFQKFYTLEKELHNQEAKDKAENMDYRRKIEESERDRQVKLARFHEREKILDNILPSQITERLIKGEQPIADKADHVSVFFSDIIGFTQLSQKITAKELVSGLNELFVQYDILAKKHGLEKIKTIGDAYMAVCGLPLEVADHAQRAANFALDIQELFANGIMIGEHRVEVRIGLHCGEVVAGVIGEQKFAYDVWGDAVNTASRMETLSEAGKIHVSEEFVRNLTPALSKGEGEDSFSFPFGEGRDGVLGEGRDGVLRVDPRGEMDIKGKGLMKTYFLEKA